jgi:pimeloyl-ACP methyl ester carboxylesterase
MKQAGLGGVSNERSFTPQAVLADDSVEWMDSMLAMPPKIFLVQKDSFKISVRKWGSPNNPPVVLVHGLAAHGGWWEPVAPWLAKNHYVQAIDLSGHGDSNSASSYTLQAWSDEVLSIMPGTRPPIIVGLSLGGHVALTSALSASTAVRGVIVIDSPLRTRSAAEMTRLRRRASAAKRSYASEGEILRRFRPIPEEQGLDPRLVRRVAFQSIQRTLDKYEWKVDPNVFLAQPLKMDNLSRLSTPLALIRGQHGLLTPSQESYASELVPSLFSKSVVPGGHHLTLSHPRAIAEEICRLLDIWPK